MAAPLLAAHAEHSVLPVSTLAEAWRDLTIIIINVLARKISALVPLKTMEVLVFKLPI